MPKMSEAFPSKYLKADVDVPDIGDGGIDLTITGAEFERIGQGSDAEDKVILSFREVDKGLVLNKTNATTITKLMGSDDTDDWIDRQVKLFATDVQYGADMMRGIRVSTRAPRPKASPNAQRRDFDETTETEAETVPPPPRRPANDPPPF